MFHICIYVYSITPTLFFKPKENWILQEFLNTFNLSLFSIFFSFFFEAHEKQKRQH